MTVLPCSICGSFACQCSWSCAVHRIFDCPCDPRERVLVQSYTPPPTRTPDEEIGQIGEPCSAWLHVLVREGEASSACRDCSAPLWAPQSKAVGVCGACADARREAMC